MFAGALPSPLKSGAMAVPGTSTGSVCDSAIFDDGPGSTAHGSPSSFGARDARDSGIVSSCYGGMASTDPNLNHSMDALTSASFSPLKVRAWLLLRCNGHPSPCAASTCASWVAVELQWSFLEPQLYISIVHVCGIMAPLFVWMHDVCRDVHPPDARLSIVSHARSAHATVSVAMADGRRR